MYLYLNELFEIKRKNDLALNNLQWLICHKTQPILYIWYICIKKNLALNDQQWSICDKTEPNQIFLIYVYNLEQVLAATPHKTPTVQPPDSYHENYSS